MIDGKTLASYGGGLCMLSDMLFWMFLHTPLTIVERHGHAVCSFPTTTEELPKGTDATVSEGVYKKHGEKKDSGYFWRTFNRI